MKMSLRMGGVILGISGFVFASDSSRAGCGTPHACFSSPNMYSCVASRTDCRGGEFHANHRNCDCPTTPLPPPQLPVPQVPDYPVIVCAKAGETVPRSFRFPKAPVGQRGGGRMCIEVPPGQTISKIYCMAADERTMAENPQDDHWAAKRLCSVQDTGDACDIGWSRVHSTDFSNTIPN